jgi:Phosphoserine phosphatase RsbU, N-terminal domain
MTDTREAPLTARTFSVAYRDALSAHVLEPGEATLHDAYELGRAVIDLELSVPDLATAHHEGLRTLLRTGAAERLDDVLAAAADFLAEALTAAEMIRRGFVEIREAERRQREHAAVLRRLSTLLADTSLAAHGRGAIAEMLQLVAEHARELTEAAVCCVHIDGQGGAGLEAVSGLPHGQAPSVPPDLEVRLTSLDGSPLGTMALWSLTPGGFSELSEAVASHLAQMASAALERAARHSVPRRPGGAG